MLHKHLYCIKGGLVDWLIPFFGLENDGVQNQTDGLFIISSWNNVCCIYLHQKLNDFV